jgi:hypothetical protein
VPAPFFMLLDGEDFILQVHWVFTRIRLGASLVASSGGARGSTGHDAAAAAWAVGLLARSISTTTNVGNGKP